MNVSSTGGSEQLSFAQYGPNVLVTAHWFDSFDGDEDVIRAIGSFNLDLLIEHLMLLRARQVAVKPQVRPGRRKPRWWSR